MQPTRDEERATEAPASAPAESVPVKDENALLKLAIDLTPLAVFFLSYRMFGLFTATAVLVGTTLLSVAAAKILLGKVSPMLIVTAVIVTLFGGLTLGLKDDRFIKIKPTVVNLLFAGALGFGLLTGKNFLKLLLGEALHLTAEGWRSLTVRWIGLFVVLAVANEFIWRTYNTPETEYIWVNFKFPGILILTFIFTALQVPLLRRHAVVPDAS